MRKSRHIETTLSLDIYETTLYLETGWYNITQMTGYSWTSIGGPMVDAADARLHLWRGTISDFSGRDSHGIPLLLCHNNFVVGYRALLLSLIHI